MKLFALCFGALLSAATLAACSSVPGEDEEDSEVDEGALVDVVTPDESPDVLIKDPRTLVALEERLSLARMLGGSGATLQEVQSSSPTYRALVAAVEADVGKLKSADRSSGVGTAFAHRLFDPRWLTSRQARFELTGVANRIDLKHRGGCGELHLVYRLAYSTQSKADDPRTRIDSRLPMTINLLAPIADDGRSCATVARAFGALATAANVAGTALSGPLAKVTPEKLEINFQLVRWPATVRPDMGGHAEYALRSFSIGRGTLTPIALDDTPRVDLAPADRQELLDWIKGNLVAIDNGTAIVPTKFLATDVVSVAPRAGARLGNKPFSTLFRAADFEALPLDSTQRIKTPAALLHRLDGMTCNGCHQSRGMAGFHLLGEERVGTARLNALATGASPHLAEIIGWRRRFLRAVEASATPPARPHADRVDESLPGTYGAHCSLGKDRGFESWTCQGGLACKAVNDDTLGHCLEGESGPEIGDSCERSTVSQSPNASTDRVSGRDVACGAGRSCATAHGDPGKGNGGFPDGMCHGRCETLGDLSDDRKTICGGVPSGTGRFGGFNKCLFELKKPFPVCLEDDARPSLLRACGAKSPCRDDYACVRVLPRSATGKEAMEKDPTMGSCMPPYFVFQGRVDGHVLYGE